MKNKYFIVNCFVVVIISFLLFQVRSLAASFYELSSQEDNKTVNVENHEIMAFAAISPFQESDNYVEGLLYKIKIKDIYYDNGELYVTFNRSEINKVIKENEIEKIHNSFALYFSYPIEATDDYYYFSIVNGQYYWYHDATIQDVSDDYKYIELGTTDVPIITNYNLGRYAVYTTIPTIIHTTSDGKDQYNMLTRYTEDDITFDDTISIDSIHVNSMIIEDSPEEIIPDGVTVIESVAGPNPQNLDVTKSIYKKYLDNQKLNYRWMLSDKDGNPIVININPEIKFDDSENKDKIYGLLQGNDSTTKIISFAHDGDLGGIADIYLYVGDKFKPGTELTLYYYNDSKDELEMQTKDARDKDYNIKVNENGYVTLYFSHCSEYVLSADNSNTKNPDTGINFNLPFFILAILFSGIIYVILKKRERFKLNY